MDGNGLRALGDLLGEVIDAMATPAVFGAGATALALVFLFSAWPKLRNPGVAALAISDFGISASPRAWTGLALGLAELTLAVLLILASLSDSGGFRQLALGASTLVLLTFSLLILRALRSGEEFACRCFGGDTSPISGFTLLRTGALAVVSFLLLIAAPRDFSASSSSDWIAELVIGAAALAVISLLGSIQTLRGATR